MATNPLRKLFEAMKQGNADEMVFRATKAVTDPETTISADAVRTMSEQTATFIMARLAHKWNADGTSPQTVEVDVSVRFDSTADDNPSNVNMTIGKSSFFTDGFHRGS